jgi:hypothetical protein
LSSISATKLSEGLLVSRIRVSIGGESTLARTPALGGVGRIRAGFATRTPRRFNAAWSRRAA